MVQKSTFFLSSRKRLIAVAISACFASDAWANPTAPKVVNGTASFAQNANALTVTNSNGAIINWNTFSIGAGESTRFNQSAASSSVLNRVLGNDPSAILGSLSSNGKVWLINPAGILVGQGARIDVGSFIASTLNVRNEDFLAGRLSFQATPGAGKVDNRGLISTPSGGSVYLVAPTVENSGVINAPNGEVILAAGQKVELIDTGTPGVKVEIVGSEGAATNLGNIASEAGRIGIAGVLVKNSGMLNASSVVSEGGRIFLQASRKIELAGTSVVSADGTKGGRIVAKTEEGGQLSGELVAGGAISARGNGTAGSGGFVETSAKWADINSVRVNTGGGTWLLDPDNVEINTSVTIGGATLVTPATIQLALTTGAFTVQTSAGGTGGNGDIFVNSGFSWSNPFTLTLSAIRDINVNQGLVFGGGLTLTALGGNVNITNSVVNTGSGGVLSVSGANLNVVSATSPATLQGARVTANMSGVINVTSVLGGADFSSSGGQTITANGIVLQAGGSGSNRNASIGAFGAQNLTVGSGGIQITGGGAGGTNNTAGINQNQNSAGGTQTIAVTGGSVFISGGAGTGNSAQIWNSGTAQSLTLVNSSSLNVIAAAGLANIASQGAQTISLTGIAANAIQVGNSASAESSWISANGTQGITAGTGVQTGSITIQGGTGAGKFANIGINSGPATQTISTSGTLSLIGGSAAGGTVPCADAGMCVQIYNNTTGLQSINAKGIILQGGASGLDNSTSIGGNGQSFTVGSGGIQITGGAGGTNNTAGINQNLAGGTQTIAVTSGSVSISGGAGTGNSAQIWNSGTAQSLTLVNSSSLNVIAAAGLANIASQGAQTISLTGIAANAIQVGNSASAESSWISANGTQGITAGTGVQTGSITIQGGTGAGKFANIGINSGPATQTISTSGTLSLIGGSAAGGTVPCADAGMCVQIYNNTTGLQSINAKGIILQGGASGLDNSTSIGGNGQSFSVGSGGIQIGGGAAGTGNSASINQNALTGSQSITVTGGNVALTGGAGTSNSANIFSTGSGLQSLSANGILLQGGAGGSNNQASFGQNSATGTQSVVVSGAISLTGGGGANNWAQISTSGSGLQTIGASGITVQGGTGAGDSDYATISSYNVSGTGGQSITAGGGGIQVTGGTVGANNFASIVNGTTLAAQAITVNNAALVSVAAQTGSAQIFSSGNQTLLIQGASSANVLTVGGAGSAKFSSVIGNNQSVMVGTTGQSGSINLFGGTTSGQNANLVSNAGTQNITTTGAINLTGGTASGSGSLAVLKDNGTGLQTVNANSIHVQGGGAGANNAATLEVSSSSVGQAITVGAGGMTITGGAGSGGGNFARINQLSSAGMQTVNVAGNVTITGGTGNTSNNAQIFNSGTAQNVTLTNADFLDVIAGTAQAFVQSNFSSGSANQSISLTGTGQNAIHIGATNSAELSGLIAGGSQVVTAGSGGSGSITLLGGTGTGKNASISVAAVGTTQTVSTTGLLTITAGTAPGSSAATSCNTNGACAGVFNAGSGQQSVSANGIVMQGGASGWFNRAFIQANNAANAAGNSQQITVGAGGISLTGGGGAAPGDDNNFAQITASSTSASQTITVNGGGTVQLQGGTSAGTAGTSGSFAHISSAGISQMLSFTGGGSLNLIGGTVGYRNSARLEYSGTNTQTISGSPAVMLLSGASGGNTLAGTIRSNSANILADNGTQTITSGAMSVIAGAGGVDSNATVAAPVQSITVNGDLSLAGSASTGSFAGARIGGRGGVAPSTTNLTLNATGNISLTGGSATGASIGSNGLGGVNTDMVITAGGNVTLTPGSGAGVRIGSPLAAVAGGNISITAGGSIALNGAGAVGTAIRTTGDVTLIDGAAISTHSIFEDVAGVIQANKLTTVSVDGTVLNGANVVSAFQGTNTNSGNIAIKNSAPTLTVAGITQNGSGSVTITNAGALAIGSGAVVNATGTGDALVLSGTGFTNNSGSSALLAPNGRWLVYSSNPATDTVGGLAYGFRQYAATLGSPVAGAGNGLIYSVSPLLAPALTGTNSKGYDGTALAILVPGNFSAVGALNGDIATLSGPVSGTYGDRNAGVSKVVSANGFSIASVGDSNGKPVFGYQLSTTSANAAIGTITPASLTVNAQSDTRGYNGTTGSSVAPTIAGTLFGTDTAAIAETYANKNAGTGKILLPTATINDGNGGANYSLSLVNNANGVITPAPLTVSGISANSKVYDGNVVASLNVGAAVVGGVFAGDNVAVSGGTGNFADRNVGVAKPVTASGFALGGVDAANYVVQSPSGVSGLSANITQLASVAWTGGSNGIWSQASNWAGGALPDGSNVLAVTIPSGSSVTYDAGGSLANTTLATLTSAGSLTLAGSAGSVMTINNQLTTPQFTMAGGSLAGSGNFTVSNRFSQTGGSIVFGGTAKAAINQASGNLVAGAITAPSLSLTAPAGSIGQSAPIVGTSLVTASLAGTNLGNPGNRINTFNATNNGSGDIVLVNTGVLNIAGISNSAGSISVDNTGALSTSGLVTATGGGVALVAHSPIVIGSAGVSSSGNILLTAGQSTAAGDDLTLGGPVSTSGTTATIVLTAGDNVNQNANVTSNGGNVTASAQTGSISMAPGTTTSSKGGSIGYAAQSGSILLTSLDAGSGRIGVSAGGNLGVAQGTTGANLTGASAIIAAGGNAQLTTRVGLLDVTVGGTFSITDAKTGTVLSDVPAPAANVQPAVTQVVSAITATTQALTVTSTPSSTSTSAVSESKTSTTQSTQTDTTAAGASTGGASPLKLIATGFTTGGAEGTFGGSSGSSSSSGSSGSSSTSGSGGTTSASSSSSSSSSGSSSGSSSSTSSGSAPSDAGSGSSSSDGGKSGSSDSGGKSSSSDSGKSSSSDSKSSSSDRKSADSDSKSAGSKDDKKEDRKEDKKDDKKKDEAQSKKDDSKASRKKPATCG